MSEIIAILSTLVAKQKLVPFMGAGCSVSMLPDWDCLTREMRERLGITSTKSHSEIAQQYVDTFGREQFFVFLKRKLQISEFDDEKGFIHLTIMNLGVPIIYTTNQDNVMEKGFEKYGKTYKTITNLSDSDEAELPPQLYIKFHGDLNDPDSIVFTTSDYETRIREYQHAMTNRLRADLLAKNLLFIGYSFRDINIRQLFIEVREAFFGDLPTSYMIAYEYTDGLQSLCDEYGILLIDPMKVIPESENHIMAFENVLKRVLEASKNKMQCQRQTK